MASAPLQLSRGSAPTVSAGHKRTPPAEREGGADQNGTPAPNAYLAGKAPTADNRAANSIRSLALPGGKEGRGSARAHSAATASEGVQAPPRRRAPC
jgi:hypothetical protein